jgi:hypothetical protein
VPIAPSTFYEYVDRAPSRRQVRDETLKAQEVYRRDGRGVVGVESLGPWGLAFFGVTRIVAARPGAAMSAPTKPACY